ncbi:MAG: helix-turn-helix domain-containing protein [Flavobacteriales bacterium]
MKLYVKFNFDTICKNLLTQKLNELEIKFELNSVGEITILQTLTGLQKEELYATLNASGIEAIDDQHLIIVQKLKDTILEYIKLDHQTGNYKLKDFIDKKFSFSYNYLSRIFTETTHLSIEQFLILTKIDYVKDLLTDGQLSLTEIAYKLNYSSISHLSKQFKKTTGFTPSFFIKLKKQLNSIT